MSKFDDFVTAAQENDAALNAALDNILADETNILKEIEDLKAQIGTGTGVLTPAQEQALDSIQTKMAASVKRAKDAAAAITDLPAPPPPPVSSK